ncbi:hypothetical protein Efla_003735 [Eimeria flavescens]
MRRKQKEAEENRRNQKEEEGGRRKNEDEEEEGRRRKKKEEEGRGKKRRQEKRREEKRGGEKRREEERRGKKRKEGGRKRNKEEKGRRLKKKEEDGNRRKKKEEDGRRKKQKEERRRKEKKEKEEGRTRKKKEGRTRKTTREEGRRRKKKGKTHTTPATSTTTLLAVVPPAGGTVARSPLSPLGCSWPQALAAQREPSAFLTRLFALDGACPQAVRTPGAAAATVSSLAALLPRVSAQLTVLEAEEDLEAPPSHGESWLLCLLALSWGRKAFFLFSFWLLRCLARATSLAAGAFLGLNSTISYSRAGWQQWQAHSRSYTGHRSPFAMRLKWPEGSRCMRGDSSKNPSRPIAAAAAVQRTP